MVYKSYFFHIPATQELKCFMPSTFPYDPPKPNQPWPCYDDTDVNGGGADDGNDNHNEILHLKVPKFATKVVLQQNSV